MGPADPPPPEYVAVGAKVGSASNLAEQPPKNLSKENLASEFDAEQILSSKIQKLSEKLRQAERRFLGVSTTAQQAKLEEIDACFIKLAQDAEQSKADSVARLKSYFVSVNKAFQATKADVESQIASLNFAIHSRLSEAQVSAVRERIGVLKRLMEGCFEQEFVGISNVRVAFNKNMLGKISEFCKIVNSCGDQPVGVSVFASEEPGGARGGAWALPSRNLGPPRQLTPQTHPADSRRTSGAMPANFPQKNLLVSEFMSDELTRMPVSSNKAGGGGSFLSRNANPQAGSSNAKSGKKFVSTASLSPIPNGFRQLLREQIDKNPESTQLKEAETATKLRGRGKETLEQVLGRALAEDAIGLNLSGLGIDKDALVRHKETLLKLKRLQVLNLDSNNIDDEGLAELREVAGRAGLERLSLQFNRVTEQSLPAIRDLCARRHRPLHLDLSCNEFALSEEKKHQFESEMSQFGVSLSL